MNFDGKNLQRLEAPQDESHNIIAVDVSDNDLGDEGGPRVGSSSLHRWRDYKVGCKHRSKASDNWDPRPVKNW